MLQGSPGILIEKQVKHNDWTTAVKFEQLAWTSRSNSAVQPLAVWPSFHENYHKQKKILI